MLGLYLLLYKPVKKIIKEREDYYNEAEKKADENLKQSEEMKAQYQDALEKAGKESAEEKNSIMAQARADSDRIISDAKDKASQIISEAKAGAAEEKARILSESKQEMVDIIMSCTEKVVSKGEDPDDALVERFIEEAQKNNN